MARGLAYGDFDRDGSLDLLITTNQGPAYLYRNEQLSGNRGLRLRLTGSKSNRDAIGALVRIFAPDGEQSRRVKSGSSYLSQSEAHPDLRARQTRHRRRWSSSGLAAPCRNQERARRLYQCNEGQGLTAA